MTAPPLDRAAMAAARARWDTRVKPPGSLGRVEDLGVHLAGVTGTCPPPVPTRPAVAVFAGDHGVVADGASAWPSAITGLMVETISSGRAAISAFAATVGATVVVVDVGVAADLGHLHGIRHARVRAGTASIARGPAMAVDEALAAVDAGRDVAGELVDGGADLLVGGEMGIGNTTPATALICALTGEDPAGLTGPGAGLPAGGLAHKQALVAAAVERVGGTTDAATVLAEVGGLEIAALAGFYASAADRRVPFVVDGVIALAALCVADGLHPGTAARAVAGHRSSEPAATAALAHLRLDPVLDLDLRLGEGTGACLAVPVVQAAAAALTSMGALPDP